MKNEKKRRPTGNKGAKFQDTSFWICEKYCSGSIPLPGKRSDRLLDTLNNLEAFHDVFLQRSSAYPYQMAVCISVPSKKTLITWIDVGEELFICLGLGDDENQLLAWCQPAWLWILVEIRL